MECVSEDQLLRPPAVLDFSSYGQELPPFTMNGAPLMGIPPHLTGAVEKRRLPTATTATSNKVAYFAADNYYDVSILGENIFTGNNDTSLRFKNTTYTLKFGALHANIWNSSVLQLSLLFQSSDSSFFHLCIPVKLDGTDETENQFLKSWLGQKASPPGITMNEVLNFRGYENGAKFATMEYCLKYNAGGTPSTNYYTVCLFDSPLRISDTSLPDWLSQDVNLLEAQTISPISPSYRRKKFDEIFNLFMRGRINVYIYSDPDPYLIGTEQHFDSTIKQSVINPAYFKCKTRILTGKQYSPGQLVSGAKGLQNVKCYPIDLASQVDEGGNIYIDENTNKPIDINEVLMKPESSSDIDTNIIDQEIAAAQVTDRIVYWVTLIILIVIFLAIAIVIIVFVFRGFSSLSHSARIGVEPLGVAPLGVAPLGVAPLGVAPLGVAPLGLAPLGSVSGSISTGIRGALPSNINTSSVATVLRLAENNIHIPSNN